MRQFHSLLLAAEKGPDIDVYFLGAEAAIYCRAY